jgi:hypothetical protein
VVLSVIGACALFIGTWAALEYIHEPWSPYLEAVLTAALVVQFWGILSLLYLFPSGSPATRGAASTLAAAALFNPLRRKVKEMVNRRFNRLRYDSEQEVARFASSLRDEVDLDDLTTALVSLAVTTLQPSAASVWIARRR